MTIRPLRPADRDALLALWNRSAPLDPLTLVLLDEKVWADPAFDADVALVAEEDGALVGFGMGVLWPTSDVLRGSVKLLAVAPEHRRQGIGGRLLDLLEDGLRARGATVARIAEASPNYLTPGVDVRYTPGWLFVQQQGYQRIGETYNLDVDLTAEDWVTDADEQRLAAEGVTIRRAEAADHAPMMIFLDQHWPAWRGEIAQAFANDPISLHLALRGDAVVAFSAYDSNNLGTGWFGPMGTDPAARGLGIGGVLLRRCLGDMKAQGHPRSVIPWVGPVGFYAHYAGATIARVFHRFEKALTAP